MDLCNPKEIKALLGRHGFHFSKSKGQNFLIQSWVPQQTAEASGAAPGVGVLEIGPGIGPLTAQLAQRGERVAAVELDATLLPILAETMAPYPNVEIVPGDILKLDLPAFCREHFPGLPVVVCANLPYNGHFSGKSHLMRYHDHGHAFTSQFLHQIQHLPYHFRIQR